MGRALRGLALVARLALLPLLATALPGCFQPDLPVCAFRCGTDVGNGRRCPESYTCQADDYCHLNGSTGACPWEAGTSTDMAAAAPADLAPDLAPPDLVPGPDLGAPDLTAPPDLGSPPDQAQKD